MVQAQPELWLVLLVVGVPLACLHGLVYNSKQVGGSLVVLTWSI